MIPHVASNIVICFSWQENFKKKHFYLCESKFKILHFFFQQAILISIIKKLKMQKIILQKSQLILL